MCYAPIATVYTTINKSNLSCRGRRVITRMAHNSHYLFRQPPLYQQRGPMKKPTMTQRKLLDVIITTSSRPDRRRRCGIWRRRWGFKSTNAVRNMLDLLKKKGHVAETTQSNHRISLTNKYRTVVVRPEGDDE